MLVRRCDPWSFRRKALYVLLQSVLPLVNLYILKLLVDSVEVGVRGMGNPNDVIPYLVAMVAVFLLNRIVSALNSINNDVLGQRLVDYLSDIMQRQAARLDMAYYDNPDFHDSLHRAQQEASFRPIQIMNNFMALFGAVVSVAGVVAMLTAASWWVIAVMVVAVLPGFAVRLYKARCIYNFRRDNTQLYRQTAYSSALLSARDYAKEMRAQPHSILPPALCRQPQPLGAATVAHLAPFGNIGCAVQCRRGGSNVCRGVALGYPCLCSSNNHW